MDEPGTTILVTYHLGFTVKPNDSSIACEHSIQRLQRFSKEKEFGCFDTPSLLVVRMNLLVPTNRVVQPFFLREPEQRFDLRTYIGFANALVEERHEHYC